MSAELIRSLFVVALPTSLSSVVYKAARDSLGLQNPGWTTDGEFLNADRFVLVSEPNKDGNRKFTVEEQERALFKKITEFLDQVVVSHGFAYKDVVQPFVVSQWIKKNLPPTLKVKRNIADVAYSMIIKNKWHYPKRLFPKTEPVELAVIRGLLRAQEALDRIPGQEVDFDRLIEDEGSLYSALTSLYGDGVLIKYPRYIDQKFRARRDEVMGRRGTPEYAAILDYVNLARESTVWRGFEVGPRNRILRTLRIAMNRATTLGVRV
ncbi:MAG: hypothetical protein ABSF96_06430 [Steroidobacteraceae bacterium]|jgi:hypothetical protein